MREMKLGCCSVWEESPGTRGRAATIQLINQLLSGYYRARRTFAVAWKAALSVPLWGTRADTMALNIRIIRFFRRGSTRCLRVALSPFALPSFPS